MMEHTALTPSGVVADHLSAVNSLRRGRHRSHLLRLMPSSTTLAGSSGAPMPFAVGWPRRWWVTT